MKQTEVGEIPFDWEVKLLLDICEFSSGKAHEQYIHEQGQYICVNSKFISTDGRIRKYSTKNIWPAQKNDILMVMSDLPNGKALAKTFFVGKDDIYAVNQRISRLRPVSGSAEFLYFLLNRYSYFLKFDDGVNQTNLTNGVFQNCPIALPPTLAEQDAIGTTLRDITDYLSATDTLISKKRDIKQGALQRLMTGKSRLPGFSKEWQRLRLEELGVISGAGVDKKIETNENPVTLLNYLDVYRRRFILPSDLNHRVTCNDAQAIKCNIRSGDVFFTPTSETPDDIAQSAVAVNDISNAVYSYHTVRLRFSMPMDVNFSAFLFESSDFRSQTVRAAEGSGTRYVITLPRFRSLSVLVPPLDEQREIGRILSDMAAEIDALVAQRAKIALIKTGMMQELLTGRTRLL